MSFGKEAWGAWQACPGIYKIVAGGRIRRDFCVTPGPTWTRGGGSVLLKGKNLAKGGVHLTVWGLTQPPAGAGTKACVLCSDGERVSSKRAHPPAP